jgi:V8-like Glu-specific endopeptidase
MKDSDITEIDGCLYGVCKSICKIISSTKSGTGFLIKLYKGNEEFYCLMTNEHVIDKEMVKSNDKIKVFYDNQTKMIPIILNEKERFIRDYQYICIDLTVVEILDKDNINKDYFLLPDLEYVNGYEQYKDKEIYVTQFPKGGKLSFSRGKIKEIDNYSYEFSHIASTEHGSSGSPIFIKETTKVVGLHKAGAEDKTKNFGNFIGPIIKSLSNDFKYDKKNYGEKIYIGEFNNNKREGYGKYIYKNGEYFICEWLNDNMLNKRILCYKDGKIKYEGDFVNNIKEGKGKYI